MCNEQASSAILAEKLSLGQKIMPVRLAKDSTRLDFLAQHLDQLTELKIYNSGEPMMSPLFQPLIKLIHERNPEIKLMISTNATAVTAQTVDQLSKIKNLSVKISIDGHGRVNEFIRYPSKWPAIEQGVGLLKQLGHDKLLVHSTVQALNYYQLGQLLKWCWENNLSYECSPVKRISMLDQRVIPEASREIYKTKIIELCKIPQVKLSMHSGVIKTLLATARSIDSGEFCPQSHQQLKNHLDNLCSIRKIDLVEYLPVESELLELIS
jgi:sulfatase maturation enzyme AslB (radical SAM superfamily)